MDGSGKLRGDGQTSVLVDGAGAGSVVWTGAGVVDVGSLVGDGEALGLALALGDGEALGLAVGLSVAATSRTIRVGAD